jgi:hypothetical protein
MLSADPEERPHQPRLDALKIFRIDRMAELERVLEAWCGTDLAVTNDQALGPSVRDFTPTGGVDAFIRTEYAEDYHALGH